MFLKPITVKKAYVDIIASQIAVWMWSNIYRECFALLKDNEVQNDSSILQEAIRKGLIYYENGAFYAQKKFSNSVATELEKIGAKYSRFRRAYVITKENLPVEIQWSIDTLKARIYSKAMSIGRFLADRAANLDKLLQKLVFKDAVNAIMKDLQDRVYRNAKQHQIELITPKLDDFMQDEIAKRYTNNLDFWIKNWTENKIVQMRAEVGKMAIQGKSLKTIAEYLEKEFGESQRHAKFLARNESAIATSSYLVAKYENEGFTHFKWHTIIDGRERDLHKELDGHIFRFDDPPIIDKRTGQRGIPGQTYNCRCSFSPYVTPEFLQNRRKMFKANNGLLDGIKQCFKKEKQTA